MEYDQTDITEVMGEASSPDDTLITLDSRGKNGKPEKGESWVINIYILTIWEGRGGGSIMFGSERGLRLSLRRSPD